MNKISIVVVALPTEDDYVRKISSENVPHLTLLYLGDDPDNIGHISEYVQHASSTLTQFGLGVTKRGVLGGDSADVLFFDKNDVSDLVRFRAHLLADPHISTAYNLADQFPDWTPHLTLGYPDTPAHADARDYPITWVNFDRVALWVGESVGPTYNLKSHTSLPEVSMADNSFESILAHFGIKGMRWGVRSKNSESGSSDHESAKAAAAKIKKGGTKSLSNRELQELVTRLNLERQYSTIAPVSGKSKALRVGGKIAGDILLQVGKEQATKLARDYATKAVAEAIRR